MKVNSVLFLMLAALLTFSIGLATAQEMTKEQWQQEITKYTQMRNDLQAKVKTLGTAGHRRHCDVHEARCRLRHSA